jgi:hypothetical protein
MGLRPGDRRHPEVRYPRVPVTRTPPPDQPGPRSVPTLMRPGYMNTHGRRYRSHTRRIFGHGALGNAKRWPTLPERCLAWGQARLLVLRYKDSGG